MNSAHRPMSLFRRAARLIKRRIVPGGIILMYHRIADEQIDPWRLCVSPANFAEHLEVLRASGVRQMHVRDLAASLASGLVPRRAVAITFDDGYCDNVEVARPLLERFEAPATLFVTSGYMGSEGEFWWDALERVFLEPGRLPDRLEILVGGKRHGWHLGPDAHFTNEEALSSKGWRPNWPPQNGRQRMYQDFRKLLMSASALNRTKIISELLTWAGVPSTARPSRRILDAAGVRQMSSGGLVEIGGHSVSHPPLGKLPPADQQEELRKSKADLEELLGQPIVGLAYPHGNCSAETTRLARAAGYGYACGTNRGPVRRGSNLYQLPRLGVGNVRGTAFKSALREFIPI